MAYFWILLSFLLFFVTTCLSEPISLSGSAIRDRITALRVPAHELSVPVETYRFTSSRPASESLTDNLEPLDIVLLASVDGKFHALNRSSGDFLWSMASSIHSSTSASASASALGPLVRTNHIDYDPDLVDDASTQHEQYIIEPQTGEIYVMTSPTSPLQRLPFSMSELVDMSPFLFAADGERRVFVGRKETSLLLIELETGRVKATLNLECPWNPEGESPIDLDELEESAMRKDERTLTEVFIGRTDYHISIYTQSSGYSAQKTPVQNLSFSVYGPNNQDNMIQSVYRRTPDDVYVQPLTNGDVISLKVPDAGTDKVGAHEPDRRWGFSFKQPIVAVFDVVRASHRANPFVLLQPLRRIEDLFDEKQLRSASFPHSQSAFVGLVEETGSLFAMGPQQYPFVAFGDSEYNQYVLGGRGDRLTIDPPKGWNLDSPPRDVDSVTKARALRKLREMCEERKGFDRRCLTGVRKLEEDALQSQSRQRRLLDAAVPERPPLMEPGESQLRQPTNSSKTRGIGIWGAVNSVLGIGSASVVNSVLTSLVTAGALFLIFRKPTARPGLKELNVGTDGKTKNGGHEGTRDMVNPVVGSIGTAEVPSAMPVDGPATSIFPSTNGESFHDVASTEDLKVQKDAKDVPLPPTPRVDTIDMEESSEKEGDTMMPGKRKGPRRKRGRKKKGGSFVNGNAAEDENGEEEPKEKISSHDQGEQRQISNEENGVIGLQAPPTPPLMSSSPSLIVSEDILGFGSHGTVVYRGSLQGRAVAVKRLLQDFVTLASREVSVLQESDDHPNVIRYYYQESRANFLFIALELCPASLADVIERPDQFVDIAVVFDPKRALREIASGLRHLHALKIVHRDIKPQNILISGAKKTPGKAGVHRMLISDFGLCKKLELDQTSFLPTAGGTMAAGTVGWRAPEVLRGEVTLDEGLTDDQSQSSRGSVGTVYASTPTGKQTRLTKSVDIFALGCLFYYVLSNGDHPFGDRFEREVNILKNVKCLDSLDRFGEEGSEATDLIAMMLNPEASERPDTSTCLLHPFFWDAGRRLTFLQDASDRFEIMCREPRDYNLVMLETHASNVVGNDWHTRLDKTFVDNLGKFRKYDGRSVQDLLRALRNKKHHYQDLPDNVKRNLGSMPEGFLSYFTKRFPRLFLHVHAVISGSALHQESMFRTYFELTD